MKPPSTASIQDWSLGEFVDQEMWEVTGTNSWIEAGLTWGNQHRVYSNPGSHDFHGWFWADAKGSTYFSHNLLTSPSNHSDTYYMWIIPKSGTSTDWTIKLTQKSTGGTSRSWQGTGTHEPKSHGVGANFGIENTCKSNYWAHNPQTIGKKVKVGSKYSWVAFSSHMSHSTTGTDTYFHWQTGKQGQKFSAGT